MDAPTILVETPLPILTLTDAPTILVETPLPIVPLTDDPTILVKTPLPFVPLIDIPSKLIELDQMYTDERLHPILIKTGDTVNTYYDYMSKSKRERSKINVNLLDIAETILCDHDYSKVNILE